VRSLAELTSQIEQVGIGKRIRLSVQRHGRTDSVEAQVVDVNRS
jgi:S1-C subfamily serine protease